MSLTMILKTFLPDFQPGDSYKNNSYKKRCTKEQTHIHNNHRCIDDDENSTPILEDTTSETLQSSTLADKDL